MRTTILLLLLASTCLRSMSQCAPEFAGLYAARSCTSPPGTISYHSTVEERDTSRFVIINFGNIPLGVIGVEDTIIANLNCTANTLSLVSVTYNVWQGSLIYGGSGLLYPDSFQVNYGQWNPEGILQNICTVYHKVLNVSIAEQNKTLGSFQIFPNPTLSILQLPNVELSVSRYVILSPLGDVIQVIDGKTNAVDVAGYSAGAYLITAFLEDGSRLVRSFIKE
jgi:hypothetical protein